MQAAASAVYTPAPAKLNESVSARNGRATRKQRATGIVAIEASRATRSARYDGSGQVWTTRGGRIAVVRKISRVAIQGVAITK